MRTAIMGAVALPVLLLVLFAVGFGAFLGWLSSDVDEDFSR